ncbi:MAG: type VII secretion protein EssC [Oscillospiraceae bacterium]|nr:type VII secretion protein EssC [Oscillospiraceae bacterium]
MSYVLTIYLKSGMQEIFLPSVQNRAVSLGINKEITQHNIEAALSLDIFDDTWSIRPNADVLFDIPYKLTDGLRIDAKMKKTGEEIVIFVEALDLGRTRFQRFRVAPGVPITLGSDRNNMIRYNTRNLVSSRHLTIEPSPAGATLVDHSSNGSFINDRRVNGRQNLRFGDTISVFDLKVIWLDDLLAVNFPKDNREVAGLVEFTAADAPFGDAEPPSADEYYSRSPRRRPRVDDEPVEIDAPPNAASERHTPLWMAIGPSLTMILPMGIGVLFTTLASQNASSMSGPFMYMGIITSAAASIIGVFWALVNARQQRGREREQEERRQKRFGEYLDRIERTISEKHAVNRAALSEGYPNITECMRWVVTQDRHLWERNVNHPDFLTARLGVGTIPALNPIEVPKTRFSLVDDELAERPYAIQKKYEMLADVPICLSLLEHKLIGVIGEDRGVVLETARIIATQIALSHSYSDVKMVFIVPPEEDWEYAKWLPHVWSDDNSIRFVANGPTSVGEVLYYLSGVIRERTEEGRQKEMNLPHYVVFIADPELVENEAAVKRIMAASETGTGTGSEAGAGSGSGSGPESRSLGFTTLLFYNRLDRLPNNCTVVLQRDKEYSGYYSLENAFPAIDKVRFDAVPAFQLAEVARLMSDIKIREAEGSGAIPQSLTFLDMYKTSDTRGIDIYRNWLENRTYESMKALIGARGGGTPVYLDIHEKYHGPHGLVAGTTGSGKSETLQTYILSLAVTYHPYEVSFILIDYKGGGMAESFNGLTHVAGIITNLGGNQTNRALASIRSEIKRRQAVFNEYKIKHIDSYIELFRADKASEPMPHLLIIADEFAELKKEQPDFVRELVSASRVGRSLGVHLILATQKPDGVVDEQIWSNTKFRICLRVAEKSDSMGMLRHPEAAYITQAGRGFFQVGNDEIYEEFQSGWSGARYEPDVLYSDEKSGEVTMINLIGHPSVLSVKAKKKSTDSEEKVIQLDAVVKYIHQVAEQRGIKPISNVWLPPLPKVIYLEDLPYAEQEANDLSVPIGLLDDPVSQEQRTVSLSFTKSNHVLVASSISGGKTTFLQTVLYGLVTGKTPDQVNIYIADYGSRTLGVFSALPHVGGVVFDDDQDRSDKLVALIMKELVRRKLYLSSKGIGTFREYAKLYNDLPAIIVAIDNLPAFMENNQKQEDNILQLAREAASYGIYLFVTCTNFSDVRSRLRQNIRFGIGIQLPDKFDYDEVVGVRGEITAEDGCPGRGLIKMESENQKDPRSLEFQTALCLKAEDTALINAALAERFKQIASEWEGELAPRIPQVPEDLSYESYIGYPETRQALRSGLLPLGYDVKEAQLVAIRPEDMFCYIVSGGARSGKTNAMQLLALESAICGYDVCVIDTGGQLSSWSSSNGFTCLITADQIYDWFSETLVPEFKRRNQKIQAAGGRKFSAQALSEDKQMIILIHDFGGFLSTVYSDTRDMYSFMESVVKMGNNHKITLIAAITRDDTTSHGMRPVYTGFASWKEGVHLGGQVDSQRIFDFEMSASERMKKHPAGHGHTIMGGKTIAVAMPLV